MEAVLLPGDICRASYGSPVRPGYRRGAIIFECSSVRLRGWSWHSQRYQFEDVRCWPGKAGRNATPAAIRGASSWLRSVPTASMSRISREVCSTVARLRPGNLALRQVATGPASGSADRHAVAVALLKPACTCDRGLAGSSETAAGAMPAEGRSRPAERPGAAGRPAAGPGFPLRC